MKRLTREALDIDLSDTRTPRDRFVIPTYSTTCRCVNTLAEALYCNYGGWRNQRVHLLYSAINHEHPYDFPDPDKVVHNMLTGESKVAYNEELIKLIKQVMTNNLEDEFPVYITDSRCLIARPEDLTTTPRTCEEYLTKSDGVLILCVKDDAVSYFDLA